jgi:hypothetical protein
MLPRLRPRVALLAAAALMLAVLAAAPGAALGAAPIGWSAPVITGAGAGPVSVSCPSDTLCVAVDPAGELLTSTEPEAAVPAWTVAQLHVPPPGSGPAPLSAVSCASATLCVAVDSAGDAYASVQPAAGAGTWSGARIDAGNALTAVSCPESSFCIAADDAGQVLSKHFPAGSWSSPLHIDGAALRAMSCATAARCAAGDAAGNILTTADGGAGWQSRPLTRGVALRSISCPLNGLCAALDAEGDVLASADPWPPAGAPTWSATAAGLGGSPAAISCSPSGLCVAVDGGEAAVASDNAAAPIPQWTESRALGASLAALSCLPSGACIAFDTSGRVRAGRVPPPQVTTLAPAESTPSTASLSGTVNPEDAVLTGCWFEYGPTSAYGAVAPCSAVPAPGSAPAAVTAAVSGLAPNTVYHYRLLASTAIAREAGADVMFTTAANPAAALLVPHPSIHGTPAVGQRLTCSPGVSGALRLTYAWIRDLVPVPFATSSTYLVKGIDSGHHLQCAVTAASAGGDATGHSAFVTVPAGGAPISTGETTVGAPRLHGHKLLVPVACSPRAGRGCNLSLRLTGTIGRRRATLGSARAFLARGSRRTISLTLSTGVRRLLARHRRVSALLTAKGTVVGVIEATISQQPLQLGPGSRVAVRRSRAARR